MKTLAIFYSEYSPTIDAIKYHLQNIKIVENPSLTEGYDLCVLCSYNKALDVNAVNIHHSLLPTFDSETPIRDAFLSGVKVTGLTIYYTKTKQIIAQYPIFISNSDHYDDIKNTITYLEQIIYPLVIEKLLLNEPFDIKDLLKQHNNSASCCSCGGCGQCKH